MEHGENRLLPWRRPVFFHTIDGDLIPISRIQKIRDARADPREPRWIVELTGEEEVVIGLSAKTKFDTIPIASFPAAPGTEVLRVDEGQLFSYAVIGWVIPQEGNPMPVTIDGINDGSDCEEYLDVRLPDGRVYRPEEAVFTLEEFKRLKNVGDGVITLDPDRVPGLAELIEAHAVDA
jgi:hypothetical protein